VQKPSAVICGVLVFLSFGIAMESFLWMWCQEVRPLTQKHTSRPSTSSRNVSGEFGLARIQRKCYFSMSIHALTQACEPGNTSPKWVGWCCPDLVLSNFHLFASLKDALRGTHFEDDNSIIEAVRKWLRTQDKSWYQQGIHALVPHWRKAV
jgi:hypothetical protein